jgi:hypothetical protein
MNWRLRTWVVGVSVGWALLLTSLDQAVAQSAPYRMRFPTSGLGGGRPPTAAVRPPKLVGSPDDTQRPPDGSFPRDSFPFADFGWYYGWDDYEYADDSTTEAYPSDTVPERKAQPSRDVYPVFYNVTEPDSLEVSSRRIASGILVRLSVPDRNITATQVAFFLADSAKNVLSAQTDRTPPFMAETPLPPRTAFAGMTVVLPNGNMVTKFVPYQAPAVESGKREEVSGKR